MHLKSNTNQMPTYHNKYKTRQHKIREKEPTYHNKHKTKVPPQVWIWFRTEREREREREKRAKLEVMGSMSIKESSEGLRKKSSAMEIGESRDDHGSNEALAMEISGGSTMGSSHGGLGDWWWNRHGFWLWWFSRLVVDQLMKSWICSSLSSPLCLSLYEQVLVCLKVQDF